MKPRASVYTVTGLAALRLVAATSCSLFALAILSTVAFPSRTAAGWDMSLSALQSLVLLPLLMFALLRLPQLHSTLVKRVAPMEVWRQEVRAVCIILFAAWCITSACALAATLPVQANAPSLAVVLINCALSAWCITWLILIMAPQIGLRTVAFVLTVLGTLFNKQIRASDFQLADLQAAPSLTFVFGVAVLLAVLVRLYQCSVKATRVKPGESGWAKLAGLDFVAQWFRRPFIDPNDQQSSWPVFVFLFPFLSVMQRSAYLLSDWGDDITAWNVIRLLFMVCFAHTMLCSNDLHVRKLLAPGGVFRRRLGQRIVASTLMTVALFATAFFVVRNVFLHVLSAFVPEAASSLTLNSALITACEVTLAVSISTLIRGFVTTRPKLTALLLGLVPVAAIALFIATGLFAFQRHPPSLGIVGPAYVAALVLLAGPCTIAANRVWARADLADLYRKQREPQTLADREL